MTAIERLTIIAKNVKYQPYLTAMLITQLLEATDYSDVEKAVAKLRKFATKQLK
jgi:hypothetical protein